jgi:hypothetical protein
MMQKICVLLWMKRLRLSRFFIRLLVRTNLYHLTPKKKGNAASTTVETMLLIAMKDSNSLKGDTPANNHIRKAADHVRNMMAVISKLGGDQTNEAVKLNKRVNDEYLKKWDEIARLSSK